MFTRWYGKSHSKQCNTSDMKRIWLILTLVAALFSSCGSDDKGEPQIKPVYKLILSNDMYKFKYNLNYDGWLYDVCLVSSNGEVYQLGELRFGSLRTYELPETHSDYDTMVLVAKVGADSAEAERNKYIMLCIAKRTPMPVIVVDGKKTIYSFTEETIWELMKYSTVEQLRQFAKEIAAEIGG